MDTTEKVLIGSSWMEFMGFVDYMAENSFNQLTFYRLAFSSLNLAKRGEWANTLASDLTYCS